MCAFERGGDIRTSAAVGDLLLRGFSPGGVSSYLIDVQRFSVRYHKPGELPAAALHTKELLHAALEMNGPDSER